VIQPILPDDGQTLTIRVPLKIRQRLGRKKVVTPDGASWVPKPRVDNVMVKALARSLPVAQATRRGCLREAGGSRPHHGHRAFRAHRK
jgi:hypothetical protein